MPKIFWGSGSTRKPKRPGANITWGNDGPERRGRGPGLRPGDVFERLTITIYAGNGKYLCRCACGASTTASTVALRTGAKKSCGCLRAERKIATTLDDRNPDCPPDHVSTGRQIPELP